MDILNQFLDSIGLKKKHSVQSRLRNGIEVERFSIPVGNIPLGFTLIDCSYRELTSEFLEEIKRLSLFDRVVVLLGHSNEKLRGELKENRIGYIDREENFYLPLDISASSEKELVKVSTREERSTSLVNEFYLGYLFYKSDGFIEKTQSELGKEIKRSASTVNFILKNLEEEEILIKVESNKYAIGNLGRYFDRWKMLVDNFQKKNLVGRFSFKSEKDSSEIAEAIKHYCKINPTVAFGGPFVDFKFGGFLNNAHAINIYMDEFFVPELLGNLRLQPDPNGEVSVYHTQVNLSFRDGIVHDSLLAAELLINKDPRINEAGEMRLSKFLKEASKRNYERTSQKDF